MNSFKDHFSSNSNQYQRYRPTYPNKLYQWLASVAPATQLAWDCATGTGQAAEQLAKYFNQVIATDGSEQQINQSMPVSNINYEVAWETHAELVESSVDLITVAQAFHWFNHEVFFNEAERVLKPDGVLAIWSYNLLTVSTDIDPIINDLYNNTLKGYWPEERRLVEEGYQSISFPFLKLDPPSFQMSKNWNLNQLLGYLGTWSAVKRYTKNTGINPLDRTGDALQKVWGESAHERKIMWPLNVNARQR